MKLTIKIALMLLILLCAGSLFPACIKDQPEQPSVVTTVPASTEATPTVSPIEKPEGTPAEVSPERKMVRWTLEGMDISVNVPENWEKNTQLVEILAENPDIDKCYAVSFKPKDIQLPQDANIGFFYVIRANVWDTHSGIIADTAINEIGRSGEFVVGYSGSNDNPYIIDSPEDTLFGELMVPTQGAMDILSVAE